MHSFQQLSQFWYDDSTKATLATVCRRIIAEIQGQVKIGLFSCPSLFSGIHGLDNSTTYIFEYDDRFSSYGDHFVHYDYTEGAEAPGLDRFDQFFDVIIVDPPFLSEECIAKVSKIVAKVSKASAKVVLCSGIVVKEWAKKYMNLDKCLYEPQHHRNLGNQFASFANFSLDEFIK